MSANTLSGSLDPVLLDRFQREIKSKVPHQTATKIENPTPLVDVTSLFVDCAKTQYAIDISGKLPMVFCKFDSQIFGGSVKVRPAVAIIENAIRNGRLKSGQVIFEATSGNFGLALGLVKKLGLKIVVLVSRKLQEGVLEELKNENVESVYLDVDICPAPGSIVSQNLAIAKAATMNVRQQLEQLRFDMMPFDSAVSKIEKILAKQDAIGLAKLLAQIYNGFCPEQYDNELNPTAHETVTGPEIDQQLANVGNSITDFKIVTTFGTGGTSAGLSNYIYNRSGMRNVHVVFPLSNQDVAGIRTKDKANGLRFYQPSLYAGIHEVDFEPARKILKFFVDKGYDIGESTALALYATLQMINYDIGKKFVILAADGISKYLQEIDQTKEEAEQILEVTPEQASQNHDEYNSIVWTHSMFVPKPDGIELVASTLRVPSGKVTVAKVGDVQKLVSSANVPVELQEIFQKGKVLLVCMAGNTSLRIAEMLVEKGIPAQSLAGGIMGLSQTTGKAPETLVQIAT